MGRFIKVLKWVFKKITQTNKTHPSEFNIRNFSLSINTEVIIKYNWYNT
jgi:hypothetical protein